MRGDPLRGVRLRCGGRPAHNANQPAPDSKNERLRHTGTSDPQFKSESVSLTGRQSDVEATLINGKPTRRGSEGYPSQLS